MSHVLHSETVAGINGHVAPYQKLYWNEEQGHHIHLFRLKIQQSYLQYWLAEYHNVY